jgi:pimeloyl-ACP methyl ester carboxylesterase
VDAQLQFFLLQGFRVIAHDRRGHGRSGQPSDGNNMDTYADDLAAVLDKLDATPRWSAIPRAAAKWRTTSAAMAPSACRRPC